MLFIKMSKQAEWQQVEPMMHVVHDYGGILLLQFQKGSYVNLL